MTNQVKTKELELLEKEVKGTLARIEATEIKTQEDLTKAGEFRILLNNHAKKIKETKEGITKPMMEALNNVRELFKPIETMASNAKQAIDTKILKYQHDEAEKAKAQEAKIVDRVEKGTLKPETAIRKLGEIDEVSNSVKTDAGTLAGRIVPSFKIVDEMAIPREYLVPDLVKIGRVVRATRKGLPGVEYYERKILV